MPTITDQAVCIRRWDFSETSQTVSLFTREHGIIRGLGKGAKRAKGAFSGGFDVLTRGQVVAISKPGAELATFTQWHLEEVFRAARTSSAGNRAAVYMADLVHHMMREHDPHPRAFDTLVDALRDMEGSRFPEWPLLHFQWVVLDEAGYRPELSRDADSGAAIPAGAATLTFSSASGGVVSGGPGPGRWGVRRQTIELLRAVAGDQIVYQPAEAAVRRANRLLASYIRDILGFEPAAMRWAFSDLDG